MPLLGKQLVRAATERQVIDLDARWRAGEVTLVGRGHRHVPVPVPVAPPARRESKEEQRSRYNEMQRLYLGLAEALEARNAHAWRNSAACRGRNPSLWFPGADDQARAAAIRICRSCIVRRHCADEAEQADVTGIWAAVDRGAV
jgi:hypothetical protein